jgi:thioredoxin reductase
LQAEKLLDFVDASVGDYYRMDSMVGGMHNPTGYELPSSSQLTAVATVPRIVAGRFRTIDDAEQVLKEGKADLVSMVRAQIADPYLIEKTKQGKALSVRPCIGCNQGCLGGANRDRHIGCTVNATAGRENLVIDNVIPKTVSRRTILVIGGGPAGMEAARVAAESGHRVILVEAQGSLGGAVNAAKRAPWMQSIGDITAWLEHEVYRLGVDVRLSTWCEIEDIDAIGADIVIVATGSLARLDGFQLNVAGEPASGCQQPHVISSTELMLGKRQLGQTALVLDTVGHFEAVGAAEFLIENGVAVTYLTGLPGFAPFTDPTGRTGPALERMYKGDFQILTRHQIVSIGENYCAIKPIHADGTKVRKVPADTVVLITPNEPQRQIFEALRAARRSNIYVIGDAKAPRDLQVAIADGNDVARAIG